jgi:hypothetical protein
MVNPQLQQFFITYSRWWSDRKDADKYANPNARYFRSPKASDDSELTWCEYMKLWWDIQSPANTRVCLAYPGLTAKEHDDEYVLLEQRLNGQVKMNVGHREPRWWSATGSADVKSVVQEGRLIPYRLYRRLLPSS